MVLLYMLDNPLEVSSWKTKNLLFLSFLTLRYFSFYKILSKLPSCPAPVDLRDASDCHFVLSAGASSAILIQSVPSPTFASGSHPMALALFEFLPKIIPLFSLSSSSDEVADEDVSTSCIFGGMQCAAKKLQVMSTKNIQHIILITISESVALKNSYPMWSIILQ